MAKSGGIFLKEYNILIYDDNNQDIEMLKDMIISEIKDIKPNIVTADNIMNAKKNMNKHISIVFLDIELENEVNGIEFAEYINQTYPETKIIFITAHVKYCESIFSVKPCGFIVKPFSAEKIKKAFDNLPKNCGQDYLIISSSKNNILKVDLNNIAYIENTGRNLTFYNFKNEKQYILNLKFSDIEKNLPHYFVRSHHSFFVNLNSVSSIQRYHFLLMNKKLIPISQRRFIEAKNQLINFWGKLI